MAGAVSILSLLIFLAANSNCNKAIDNVLINELMPHLCLESFDAFQPLVYLSSLLNFLRINEKNSAKLLEKNVKDLPKMIVS